MNERKKKIIEKILEKNKIDINNNFIEEYKKFKTNIDSEIKKFNNKKLIIEDKDELYDLYSNLKDKESLMKTYYKYLINIFNDKKYRYNFVIFLKSGKPKCFYAFENTNIQGITYKNNYYNIDSKSIIFQNNNAFLFYKEGESSPINFMKSNYENENYTLKLSGENLKDIVEGKTFKGIIKLGKPENVVFDWKMIIIGLGILAVVYLQMTGQIDLNSMLGLK